MPLIQIDTQGEQYWVVIAGVVISITMQQAREIMRQLGPAFETEQSGDDFYMYRWS